MEQLFLQQTPEACQCAHLSSPSVDRQVQHFRKVALMAQFLDT